MLLTAAQFSTRPCSLMTLIWQKSNHDEGCYYSHSLTRDEMIRDWIESPSWVPLPWTGASSVCRQLECSIPQMASFWIGCIFPYTNIIPWPSTPTPAHHYITQFLLSFLVCCNLLSIAADIILLSWLQGQGGYSITSCLDIMILYRFVYTSIPRCSLYICASWLAT